MERAAAAALVVDEPGLAVAQHHVAALEVAVEEVRGVGLEEEVDQPLGVALEAVLVERDLRELQEVILEVVEVPPHRRPVERRARVGERVVDDAAALHLEARELGQHPPIDGQHRRGEVAALGRARVRQRAEERQIAEVLDEVDPGRLVDGVHLGDGQPDGSERLRVREERAVLLGIGAGHRDGGGARGAPQPDHPPLGAVGRDRLGRDDGGGGETGEEAPVDVVHGLGVAVPHVCTAGQPRRDGFPAARRASGLAPGGPLAWEPGFLPTDPGPVPYSNVFSSARLDSRGPAPNARRARPSAVRQ